MLDRATLDISWDCRRLQAAPFGWANDERYVFTNCDEDEYQVWDVESKALVWERDGLPFGVVAGNGHVLFVTPDGIQVRRATDGQLAGEAHFGERYGVEIVGRVIVSYNRGIILGHRFPDCKPLWTLELPAELREDETVLADEGGSERAVVLSNGHVGVLDLHEPRILWARRIPTSRPPRLVGSRVVCIGGSASAYFTLLDAATGRTITSRDWVGLEGGPRVFWGGLMLSVGLNDISVTDLFDGRHLGDQIVQKGPPFCDCQVVDGCLLATREDGSLWVFEPNESAHVESESWKALVQERARIRAELASKGAGSDPSGLGERSTATLRPSKAEPRPGRAKGSSTVSTGKRKARDRAVKLVAAETKIAKPKAAESKATRPKAAKSKVAAKVKGATAAKAASRSTSRRAKVSSGRGAGARAAGTGRKASGKARKTRG